MLNNLTHTAVQPYVKLVQANMELLTKFSTSPEVVAQAATSAQGLFRQGQESAAKLVQSNAFAQLTQGMLRNYTEFLTTVGQAGMTMLSQGQAALTRQIQEGSEKVVEASQAAGRGVPKIG